MLRPSKKYALKKTVSSDTEVRKYEASNWYSKAGVYRKMRQIQRKGIPNLKDWRFITLTLDPDLFDSELDGYLKGKARLRRFLVSLRKMLGLPSTTRWAWKLEFQKDGMAHWHLYFEYKGKLTLDELEAVTHFWKLGRTNVKRCDESGIDYAFKYAMKPVFDRKEGDDDQDWDEEIFIALPDWFLDYTGTELVKVEYFCEETGSNVVTLADAPTSFSRVRFWQTSCGFYTGVAEPVEVQEPFSCMLPRSFRVVAKEALTKVQITARSLNGNYIKSAVVCLSCTAASFFSEAGCQVLTGAAAPSYNQSYIVGADFLNERLKPNEKQKLCQIQKRNQLSVKYKFQLLQAS